MSNIETFSSCIEDTHRLNDWIFELAQPYIIGRVFETHSCIGEFSSRLVENGFTVQLNATSETNREFLRQKFQESPLVRGIHKMDLGRSEMEPKYSKFEESFSTVLVLGDLESRVFPAKTSIDKAKLLIPEGGRLIVIGQCQTIYFPGVDQDIQQLSRHNHNRIASLLSNCSFFKIEFFDWVGPCFLAIAKKH